MATKKKLVINPTTGELDYITVEMFFYDLIDTNEIVVVEQNRLLLYKDHITVLGHLTVKGRLAGV